jgi:UTP--glucose-1-phosphate uridylyltransferase
MRIRKVLVTAANPRQRTLPLQTLIDPAGEPKSALQVVLEEAAGVGIEEFGVVVCPGDEHAYAEATGPLRSRVRFIVQDAPRGYGHAVLCGRPFTGEEPFLHLVGDHLHVSQAATSCARQLLDIAAAENAPVSAVQPTRESQLTSFGAIGGRLVGGARPLYHVEAVIEKPTPTIAEQQLIVPGLRAGFYLCFFGMHVLDRDIYDLLEEHLRAAPDRPLGLSPALHALAARRRYLAFSIAGRRFDIGAPYGLLFAQLALSLSGRDRDRVLSQLVELLAVRSDGT